MIQMVIDETSLAMDVSPQGDLTKIASSATEYGLSFTIRNASETEVAVFLCNYQSAMFDSTRECNIEIRKDGDKKEAPYAIVVDCTAEAFRGLLTNVLARNRFSKTNDF